MQRWVVQRGREVALVYRVVTFGRVVGRHVRGPGVIATGVVKLTCCQPEAVSPVNVAVASLVPPVVHSVPVCVPVLVLALKNRTPVMLPATSELNLTPTSTLALSGSAGVPGTAVGPHSEQGHPDVWLLAVVNDHVTGAVIASPERSL